MSKYRDEAIALVDYDIVSMEVMTMACLKYMSDSDIKDMLESNGFINEDCDELDD